MIAKVISGGQAGVDRAALDVAIEFGIPHGGYCPKGRKAEDGRIPDRYLLTELPTAAYPPRTRANVKTADATLVLVDNYQVTGGTALTCDCAREEGRPLFVAGLDGPSALPLVGAWLESFAGKVVNVAGPRESKSPGIYERAAAFLRLVLAP